MLLEVGDRSAGDSVSYPADDIQAVLGTDGKGSLHIRTVGRTKPIRSQDL